jgi:hypothetical protein
MEYSVRVSCYALLGYPKGDVKVGKRQFLPSNMGEGCETMRCKNGIE